jgi:hypothetical protein
MFLGRRTLILLLALGVVGAPAVVLRTLCVGHSCDAPAKASSTAPFCRLPADIRRELLDGYREERSPDVFAVTRTEGALDVAGTPWPGIDAHVARLPFVMTPWGDPVGRVRADQVAPTIAGLIGLDRPHPEVRSGEAVRLRTTPGSDPPRVVLLIGIKGWGHLERAPRALRGPIDEGMATEIVPASVPADPAALFTTVGTGGLPRQHGITGSVIRDPDGASTSAWGPNAPTSVIATLADDLDELSGQQATVAMVAHDAADRGLIGDGWYVDADNDTFIVEPRPGPAGRAFERIVQDVEGDALYALTVDIDDDPDRVDKAIENAMSAIESVAGDEVLTVAVGTGARPEPAIDEAGLIAQLGETAGLIERIVAGGFFLDQRELARTKTSEDAVVDALKNVEVDGRPLFADVFTGISLAFGRYC